MVSELDRYLPPVGIQSLRESATRGAASTHEALPHDPEVRLTLSAASRRLSDLPDASKPSSSESPGSPPLAHEPPTADSRAAAAPRPPGAYREPAREALGERLSIRV